jgi:TolB-like protein
MKRTGLFLFLMVINGLFCFAADTIDEAIINAQKKLQRDLPANTKIAVLNFDDATKNNNTSANTVMAKYVVEKLEMAFTEGKKLVVVNRSKLDVTHAEASYQFGGYVDDASAVQFGKELGAETIVTGKLTKLSGDYDFSIIAIQVQTSVMQSTYQTRVKMDKTLEGLLGITDEKEQAARQKQEKEDQLKADVEREKAMANARRDNRIVVGVRGDFYAGFNEFVYDEPMATAVESDFFDTFAVMGFVGYNSISKAMGVRLEAAYINNNIIKFTKGQENFSFSYDSLDVSLLFDLGFAEKGLFVIYVGPYLSIPLGSGTSTYKDAEIDKPIMGFSSSWGVLGGLTIGFKVGPGYIALDGRYAYDLNSIGVKFENSDDAKAMFDRRGITFGLGYELWL